MYKIKEVLDSSITQFFIEDPALCYLGLPDDDLVNLYSKKEYIKHATSNYKGIYSNKQLVGILCYEYFTAYTLNVHFYVSTKLQKKSQATKVKLALKNYFIKKYPGVLKIVLTVPSSCGHVIAIAEHYGFKKEGHLTNCIRWRDNLADIFFYAKDLKEV